MSLIYRTPVENLINQLPSRLTENVAVKQVDILQNMEESIGKYFNFNLSKEQKKFLVDKGVYLSPFSWKHHSHPGCKTIENWLLYNEIGFHIRHICRDSSVAFLSLREGKLKNLEKIHFRQGNHDQTNDKIRSFNKIHSPKDCLRYSSFSDRETLYQSFRDIGMKMEKRSCYFIHDECHYWNPADLDRFIRYTDAESIMFTVIHPVEVDVGKTSSHLPFLYEFCIDGETLHFFPDGNKSEGYEQPLSAGWWLKMSRFISRGEVYNVTLLRSIGPFHLMFLSRGGRVVESKRFFTDFNILDIPSRFNHQHFTRDVNMILRANFIKKIISYIKSLKKPDRESAIAKLRMMSEDDFSIEEMLFVEGLIESMLKDGIRSIWEKGWMDGFMATLRDLLPPSIHSALFRKDFKARENLMVLIDLKPLTITLPTADYHMRSIIHRSVGIDIQYLNDEQMEFKGVQEDLMNSKSRGAFLFGSNRGNYHIENGITSSHIVKFSNGSSDYFDTMDLVEGINPLVNRSFDFIKNCYPDSFDIIRNNKEFQSNAINRSLKKSEPIHKNYGVVIINELSSPTVFEGFNKGYIMVLKGSMSGTRLIVYIVCAAYLMHKQLEYNETKANEVSSKHMNKKEKEMMILDFMKTGDTDDHVSKSRSTDEQKTKEQTNLSICESKPIDERTFCNLKNKCCFDSVLKCLNIDLFELVDRLKGSVFIELLIKDQGLLESEFLDLLDLLGLNENVMNAAGFLVKECTESSGIFILSSNHCRFISKEECGDWFNKVKGGLISLPGVNYLLKDINCIKRAGRLFKSLSRGNTGILFNSIKKKSDESEKRKDKNRVIEFLNLIFDNDDDHEVEIVKRDEPIYGFFGFAGSGKSRAIQGFINSEFNKKGFVTIISPRSELLKDWQSKVKTQNKHIRFLTFERALTVTYQESELIVIDEIGLMPPGYMSLLNIITSIKFEEVSNNFRLSRRNFRNFIGSPRSRLVVLGDHLQCRYYNDSDVRSLDPKDEIVFLMENEEIIYLNYSHRMSRSHHYKPGVVFLNDADSVPTKRFLNTLVAKKSIPNAQVLVASHDEQIRFRDLGAKTFGESQGLTFDESIIVLSPPSTNCSLFMWNVAMSRSIKGVHFALNGFDSIDDFLNRVKGTPVAAMILGMKFDIHAQPMSTPEDCKIICSDRLCLSSSDVENKLEGDPFLKSIIPSMDEGLCVHHEYQDVNFELPTPKIHLPIESIQSHVAFVSSMIRNREFREFIGDGEMSEQFPDFFKQSETGSFLSQAERFQAIFPKHSNGDSLTFFAAVKKRLKFSSPQIEREKFEKVRHLGSEMFELLLEKIPLDNKNDDLMMQICVNEYIERKVSKPAGTIKSHSGRSDCDWKLNDVFLFIKTQLCTKYEKRFSDAKAGQTLACFSHVILNRFAAPARYIEKKLSLCLPDNYYIHQKKNFDMLNAWVVRNDFSDECLESDYEAFDSSQDCLILAFEYELLKYMGWSQSLLDDYLDLKFNLGCRLGNLAVMRFTGEFGTFLFNTLANMVFTFMSYDLTGKEAICFAGDDMCCNKGIRRRTDGRFDHILNRLSLKAKAVITTEPTFCGWRLTKYGIFKKPELVLERFLIAIEKNKLKDVIDSYYLECSYAYSLGERLFECFSEKDFVAHYCCIRLVHLHKDLLRGQSLDKYISNQRFGLGCKLLGQKHLSKSLMEVKRTSTASVLVVSTPMEVTHKIQRLMLHRNLRVPYLSECQKGGLVLSREYQSLTQRLCVMREQRKSIKKLTLVQLLSVYTSMATMTKKPAKENACWLMEGEMMKMVSLTPSGLMFQKVQLILSLHQMLFLISMMSCLTRPVSCTFHLKVLSTEKVQDRLLLRLELSTGCQMHSTVIISWEFQGGGEILVAPFRKFMAQALYNQEMCIRQLKKWLKPKERVELVRLELNQVWNYHRGQGKKLCLGKKEDLAFIGNTLWIVTFLKSLMKGATLGQAQVTLMKEEFLKTYWAVRLALPYNHQTHRVTSGKMAGAEAQANQALRNWIDDATGFQGEAYGVRMRKLRRRTLLRDYWVSHMKAEFQNLGHANEPQSFTAAESTLYGNIMSDFASHAFGVLAEDGFSPATVYSSVNASYTVDYRAPVGNKTVEFSPAEVARVFKYLYQSSANPIFENMTWRQCGEAFAGDIVRYFKELQPDAQSWLVKSNPVLAGNAPWVALDVTDGLDIRHLNPEEKKVIARAKNHLLRSMQLKGRESLSAEALLES
ncbi:RNA-dependent RNA polymerase [Ocimum basilicum RNA virus 1]|uniref:RNA-dependent RNA polymerase n=1 Tax=Ocimum basilicum RNA virus 1 TaxID=2020286 RepID=UPI000B5E0EDC|nr:RNA-dependent RNA polymerase [Ocimum basilicum RNA virus 1]ASL68496.1 RNA-dependent RNA polymerase [Ocimum basilicum RNA virus 1]